MWIAMLAFIFLACALADQSRAASLKAKQRDPRTRVTGNATEQRRRPMSRPYHPLGGRVSGMATPSAVPCVFNALTDMEPFAGRSLLGNTAGFSKARPWRCRQSASHPGLGLLHIGSSVALQLFHCLVLYTCKRFASDVSSISVAISPSPENCAQRTDWA